MASLVSSWMQKQFPPPFQTHTRQTNIEQPKQAQTKKNNKKKETINNCVINVFWRHESTVYLYVYHTQTPQFTHVWWWWYNIINHSLSLAWWQSRNDTPRCAHYHLQNDSMYDASYCAHYNSHNDTAWMIYCTHHHLHGDSMYDTSYCAQAWIMHHTAQWHSMNDASYCTRPPLAWWHSMNNITHCTNYHLHGNTACMTHQTAHYQLMQTQHKRHIVLSIQSHCACETAWMIHHIVHTTTCILTHHEWCIILCTLPLVFWHIINDTSYCAHYHLYGDNMYDASFCVYYTCMVTQPEWHITLWTLTWDNDGSLPSLAMVMPMHGLWFYSKNILNHTASCVAPTTVQQSFTA